MSRFPIPVLALLACAPLPAARVPTCRTPCGLVAYEGDCAALRRFETRAVRRLAQAVPEWSAEKTCDGLRVFRLEVRHHDLIRDDGCSLSAWRSGDACYYGLTSFEGETITIANSEWGASALAHEFAHVAEASNTGHPGHCRWTPSFKAVLAELSTLPDPSTPEDSCRTPGAAPKPVWP